MTKRSVRLMAVMFAGTSALWSAVGCMASDEPEETGSDGSDTGGATTGCVKDNVPGGDEAATGADRSGTSDIGKTAVEPASGTNPKKNIGGQDGVGKAGESPVCQTGEQPAPAKQIEPAKHHGQTPVKGLDTKHEGPAKQPEPAKHQGSTQATDLGTQQQSPGQTTHQAPKPDKAQPGDIDTRQLSPGQATDLAPKPDKAQPSDIDTRQLNPGQATHQAPKPDKAQQEGKRQPTGSEQSEGEAQQPDENL